MNRLKKGIVILLTVSLLLPGYHTLFETVIAEAKTFTRNEQDKAALEKFIKEQRALGSDVSQNIDDSDFYGWNADGRLVRISWNEKGLTGNLSFSDFPELEKLECNNNDLAGIDISQNTKLEILYCQNNRIRTLDLRKHTKLIMLYCKNNLIESLELSDSPELIDLDCSNNFLTDLNLKNNEKLELLHCSINNIKNLDLRSNILLDYFKADKKVNVTGLRGECESVRYCNNSFFDENGYRYMILTYYDEEEEFSFYEDDYYYSEFDEEYYAKSRICFITGYIGDNQQDVFVLPSTVVNPINDAKYQIVGIGDYVFAGHTEFKKVRLEEGFKFIGVGAFKGCNNLEDFFLPNGLKQIGDYAFAGCEKLSGLVFPPSLDYLALDFYKNTASKKVELYIYHDDKNEKQDDVVSKIIGSWWEEEHNTAILFEDINKRKDVIGVYTRENICYELHDDNTCAVLYVKDKTKERVSLPDKIIDETTGKEYTVTGIEEYAFYENKALKSITFPQSIKEIGECAFELCKSLESITIPCHVKKIKESTFSGCSSLKVVSIPEGVKEIKDTAFATCKRLGQVVIPKSVTSISDSAFEDCIITRLTFVTPKGSKAYNYAKKAGIMTSESTKIKFSPNNIEMYPTESILLYAYNAPGVVFKSSNKSVATISEYGQLKAKKTGKTTIIATVSGKNYKLPLQVYKKTTKNVLKIIYKRYVTKDMTDYEKIKAAHKWLIENVKYDKNAYYGRRLLKNSHDAKGAFETGIAVCDGYSKAFQKIMKHYGIPCKIISGRGDGFGHAWNLVKIKNKWYHVDCTFDDPIVLGRFNNKEVYYDNFLKTDKYMRNDSYSWNAKSYPKANSKKIDKKYRTKK